jgi:hypothetical protein
MLVVYSLYSSRNKTRFFFLVPTAAESSIMEIVTTGYHSYT